MDIAEDVARAEDAADEQKLAQASRSVPLGLVDLEPRPAQLPAVAKAQRSNITPADLIDIAMQSGDKDIERLERLMQMDVRYRELQEQQRKEARLLAYRAAFIGLSGEGIVVPKTKHVDRGRAGSFEQAEFDEVKRRLSGPCARHGFGFRFDQKFGTKLMEIDGKEQTLPWVWVWCFLDHAQGHTEVTELEGPAGDLPANTVVQNQQATASYLKRVALLAITGTATGGEDDESKLAKQQKGEKKSERGDELRDAGRAASMDGMKSLLAWWGALSAKDRADMQRDYPSLRKSAEQADRENSNA